MAPDRQLLRQYVQQGSQAAFSQIVARHLNLVYSLCLREVHDSALAEDVTQVVFLILAKKAPALRSETHLSGWLFHTARFACKNALRREARHKLWEQKAVEEMRPSGGDENALWDQVGPTLNDALASLGSQDREAVLLRFFEESSFVEIGAALGTSEDAARMRLNRAMERLRRFYAKEGVAVSAAVLIGLLADRAVQAAPAACAAAVTQIAESANAGVSVGGLSAQVHSQLQGTLKAMTISKLKLAATIGMGVILAGSLPFVTRAQNHAVKPAPQAALPNPHPIPSDTATRLGSLSLPAVSGWTKEYGNYLPSSEVVYYKLVIAEATLSARVLYMPLSPGVLQEPPLVQTKADMKKVLTDPEISGDSHNIILVSNMVRYHQQPAIYMVWDVHTGKKVHRVRLLAFNRGRAHYQIYLYVYSMTPATFKKGDQFWQGLTSGLRDQGS